MSIKTNTSAPSVSRSPGSRLGRNALVAAIGASAVIGGTVFATGLWTGADDSGPSPSAGAVTSPAGSGITLSYAAAVLSPHNVYIVGTEDQAATIAANLNEANAIRDRSSEPALLDEVLVARSDTEAAAIVAAVNEANAILAAQGLTTNVVVDLRG